MQDKRNFKDDLYCKMWNLEQDIKIGARKTFRWINENREFALAIGTTAIGLISGANKIAKRIDRKVDLKKEQELKDLRVYNRSTGDYLTLRRKMSAKEQVVFETRKKSGESTAAILYDMGLLK